METGDFRAMMTPAEYAEAAERGRSMAAHALREDPDKLAKVEAMAGRGYCQLRYPEAYDNRKFTEN
jgi:hypothetical protein